MVPVRRVTLSGPARRRSLQRALHGADVSRVQTSRSRVVTRFREQDRRLRWLALLLSPLPVVLLVDLAQRLLQDDGRGFFAVEGDRSLIEVLGYLQASAAVVLLVALAVRTRAPVYAGWGVLFACVVIDDAAQLHEIGGERLASTGALTGVPGLRAEDVGELLVWAGLGVVLLGVLTATWFRSDTASRRTSGRFAAPLLVLVVFAVGIDMVNSQLHDAPPAIRLLGSWTEATGELAALSLLLALALDLYRPAPDVSPVAPAAGR